MRPLVLLFDLGDTIMVEETEIKDAEETTLSAELVPGMADALRAFKAAGHRLALVADSRPGTPANVLGQHGLAGLFEAHAISEVVGAAKPDPRIFRAALDALGIEPEDYGRVVMVGNNLERDIVGANRLGLISVFYHLNDRRRTEPLTADEVPCYTVRSAAELRELIMREDLTGCANCVGGRNLSGLVNLDKEHQQWHQDRFGPPSGSGSPTR